MDNSVIDQLKSLYSQLFNLIEDSKQLVADGSTNDAVQKALQIKNLSKQIKFARLGIKVPEEFKEEIKGLELRAVKEIKDTLDGLIQIKTNLKENLNAVNNNIKLKNAYSVDLPRVGETFYEEE